MGPLSRRLGSAFLALALAVPAYGQWLAPKDAFGDLLPDGALMRLGTARFRTPAYSRFFRLSPDGARLAVAGQDAAIRLFNAADGAEVRRIPLEQPGLNGLAFTPAGDLLATTGYDGSVRFWDTTTGKPLGRIDTKPFIMRVFTFSADGKTLVAAPQVFNQRAVVHAYEVPGGKEIGSYEVVQTANVGVAVSADGKTLASWGQGTFTGANNQAEQLKLSQTVQIWDAATSKEARRIETDRGAVSSVAFAPDGKVLALAAGQGALQFWDPAKGTLLRTFQGRTAYGQTLTFSRDGKLLFASGTDGRMQAWEVGSGKRLSLPDGPTGVFGSLAFPSDGRVLACGLSGQAILIWEPLTGRDRTFGAAGGHRAAVGALAFTDARTLWSASGDGAMIEWDAAKGTERKRQEEVLAPNDMRRNMNLMRAWLRFSPGGKYLLSGSDAGRNLVGLRETATNQEVLAFASPAVLNANGGLPAAFAPDGSLLAVAEGAWQPTATPRVHVWEPDSGRELFALSGFKGQATALAVAPDGKTLAVATGPSPFAPRPGANASEVLLCDLAAGKEPRPFKQYGGLNRAAPVSLAYSPDGRVLVAADGGGAVVWDVATGAERWQASSVGERLLAPVEFSPDGRLLAIASQPPQAEEGHIRLWETASGKVRREFTGHFGPVTSLAFSPDGGVLASGCQDTTILLWDATGMKAAEAEGQKGLKADVLDTLWSDLASTDAVTAGRAVARLAVAPADAVPYLKKQVRPAEGKTTDEAAIVQRVADLDADDFGEREKAQRDLRDLGAVAGPALRKALTGEPQPELKRRAEELLERLGRPDASPEALRRRRAVEALERAGTPDARDWLEALAKGQAGADVTEDAAAAVKRLVGRPDKAP